MPLPMISPPDEPPVNLEHDGALESGLASILQDEFPCEVVEARKYTPPAELEREISRELDRTDFKEWV